MTLNKFRGLLYRSAKYLGDVQAVRKAVRQGDLKPIGKRIQRRITGRLAGRFLGWLNR